MTQSCASARLSLRFIGLVLLLVLLAGCVALGLAQQRVNRAQKTVRVSGYVLDSVSHKPVAGVVVKDKNREETFAESWTDASGYFVLHLPASGRKSSRNVGVQTVLYEGWAPVPANPTAEITILLHRNHYAFPKEDDCAGVADSLRMAPFAAQRQGLSPGTGLAIFVENKRQDSTARIRAIGIDAEKMGLEKLKKETYWLRVYRASGPEQAHGEILRGPTSGFVVLTDTTGKQWIDLKDWEIAVPTEGVVVELEGSLGCDKCYQLPTLANYTPTGPRLRSPCTIAEARNWLYVYKMGYRRLTPAENPVPLYRQGIEVELVGSK